MHYVNKEAHSLSDNHAGDEQMLTKTLIKQS